MALPEGITPSFPAREAGVIVTTLWEHGTPDGILTHVSRAKTLRD